MGHERWFRGQHDGQNRPFDWLTPARQHGIHWQHAQRLYEQAVQQAHGAALGRVQEIYLALLADARRAASRPSPGKVTRTMRLEAERAGKRRGPRVSRLTGQPIAPGKRTLTSYLAPPKGARSDSAAARALLSGVTEPMSPAHELSVPDMPEHRALSLESPDMMPVGGLHEAPARRSVHDASTERALDPDIGDLVDRAARRLGSPLPNEVEKSLGQVLGMGLSAIRVHTDPESAAAATALRASAYTVGQDIHFSAGTYDLDTLEGLQLLAHEVAHAVQ